MKKNATQGIVKSDIKHSRFLITVIIKFNYPKKDESIRLYEILKVNPNSMKYASNCLCTK